MGVSPEMIIKISGNSAKFQAELKKLERQAQVANGNISKDAVRRQDITEKAVLASYKKIAVAAAALAVGIGVSFNQFVKYEEAVIGVQKTTDIAGDELEKLKNRFVGLSSQLGQSQASLFNIAEAAGQLGVRGADNLTKFTETIAKLNVASKTLQGEQAAQSLARILTITGEGFANVDRFASVIARLGDNFATTEAQIAEMTLNIVQAGGTFKTTATEAAALAAAFAQLGINPEIARTTLLQFGVAMEQTFKKGGEEMRALMALTGMTEAQLKKTFKESPVDIFQAFLKGLDGVIERGGSAADVLRIFGMENIRTLPTMATAAKSHEEIAKALDMANTEYRLNVKLNEEFQRKTEGSKFAIDQMKVAVDNAAIALGEMFAPLITGGANAISFMINDFLAKWRSVWVEMKIAATENIQGILNAWQKLKNFFSGKFEDTSFSVKVLNTEEMKKQDTAAKTDKSAIDAQRRQAEEERKILADHLAKQADARAASGEAEVAKVEEDAAKKREAKASANAAEIEQDAENWAVIDGILVDRDALDAEKEAEKREAKLEREQAEFEEDLTLLDERLKIAGELRDAHAIKEVAAERTKHLQTTKLGREQLANETAIAKDKILVSQFEFAQKIGAFREYIAQGTALSKALFLVEKAAAFASAVVSAHKASALALAQPPGPPVTIPMSKIALAMGYAQAAGIAATAITGFTGAKTGGYVPGGFGGGDKVPMMLEPGEGIVPNKLMPSFEQFIREDRGTSGAGQNVGIMIEMTEDASRIFTAKQREDRKLGIQKT